MKKLICLAVFVNAPFLAALLAPPDDATFKGGVRIAAGSCATYPVTPGSSIMTGTGDISISNPTQAVNVRMVCHLPVPEGAVIRRVAVVGKVTVGEVLVTLSTMDPKDPGQAPFYANISLTPSTAHEIPGKQQRAFANLPVSGSESLKVDRKLAHYIDVTFTSPGPVSAAQALIVRYFEVYWN